MEVTRPIKFLSVDHTTQQHIQLLPTASDRATVTRLPAPVRVVLFYGLGRAGKSLIASGIVQSLVRQCLNNNVPVTGSPAQAVFESLASHLPATVGIDCIGIPSPDGHGSFIILDAEGGSNGDQLSHHFVLGAGSSVASVIVIVMRNAFITHQGLDVIMSIRNTRAFATANGVPAANPALFFVENDSNVHDPSNNPERLRYLLNDNANQPELSDVRRVIREEFRSSFITLPRADGTSETAKRASDPFQHAVDSLAQAIVQQARPLVIGNEQQSGEELVAYVSRVVDTIRDGSEYFDTRSATFNHVAASASQHATRCTTWFEQQLRNVQLHGATMTATASQQSWDAIFTQVAAFQAASQQMFHNSVGLLEPQAAVDSARRSFSDGCDAILSAVRLRWNDWQTEVSRNSHAEEAVMSRSEEVTRRWDEEEKALIVKLGTRHWEERREKAVIHVYIVTTVVLRNGTTTSNRQFSHERVEYPSTYTGYSYSAEVGPGHGFRRQ